jgi:hypothetical protein
MIFLLVGAKEKKKKMVSGLYTNIPFIYKYSLCRSIIGSNFLKKYFPPLNKKKIPTKRFFFFFFSKMNIKEKETQIKVKQDIFTHKTPKIPFSETQRFKAREPQIKTKQKSNRKP